MESKTFDSVARWYDCRLPQKYLARLHKRSIEIAAPLLREGMDILDVGCGTGNFLYLLSWHLTNLRLYGIDESAEMLARARAKQIPAEFVLGRAEKLPYTNASFDFVFIVEALHHFHGPRAALNEAGRVLRPSGMLLILDPLANGIVRKTCLWVVRRIVKIEHNTYCFTSEELDSTLAERGFVVLNSRRYLFQHILLARKAG